MNKFDEAIQHMNNHDPWDEIATQALRLASFMQEHKEYFVWQPISEAPRDKLRVFLKID